MRTKITQEGEQYVAIWQFNDRIWSTRTKIIGGKHIRFNETEDDWKDEDGDYLESPFGPTAGQTLIHYVVEDKLKPFDLEKALAGEKVITKRGRKVSFLKRVVPEDAGKLTGHAAHFPLVGINQEGEYTYVNEKGEGPNSPPLYMSPEEKEERWVNVYSDNLRALAHESEEAARTVQHGDGFLRTVKLVEQ